MKNYRLDIFINGEHFKRYFDDIQSAKKSAIECQRDGANKVFLLKNIFENFYDVVCEL